MNTPVSFELAKLLKEKGFKQRTKSYTEDAKLVTVSLTIRRFIPEKIYYPAPTIAEVVMWLYKKYGIWISVLYQRHSENKHWKYNIRQLNGIETVLWEHNTIEEAYEAAINYTLNNLI